MTTEDEHSKGEDAGAPAVAVAGGGGDGRRKGGGDCPGPAPPPPSSSPYECSACGGSGPFSHRQEKRAEMGEPARCKACIEKEARDRQPQEKEKVAATTAAAAPPSEDAHGEDAPKASVSDGQKRQPEGKRDPEPEKKKSGSADEKEDEVGDAKEKPSAKGEEDKCYFSDGQSAACSSPDDEDGQHSSHGGGGDDDGNDNAVSLKALKDGIMGRKVIEKSGVNDPLPAAPANMEELKSDLTCTVCHEIFDEPLSLTCGHNFCTECLSWWLTERISADTDAIDGRRSYYGKCPVCRRNLPAHHSSFKPNAALRSCVLAVFGDDLRRRREEKLKLTKGEDGGAHDRGCQVMTALKDEPWKKLPGRGGGGDFSDDDDDDTKFAARRSIVLDAEDQRMQRALALYREDTPLRSPDGALVVQLCSLYLEEDEVSDGRVPIRIVDEDDEHLIDREDDHVVRLVANLADGSGRSVESKRLSDGTVEFHVGPMALRDAAELYFFHEGAETELSIRLGGGTGGEKADVDFDGDEEVSDESPVKSRRRRAGQPAGSSYFYGEEHDPEDEGSNEYEDDGFLVGDEEEVVEEDHADDECCVCGEVGELMICDGGDHVAGCGRGFHFGCVGRDEVPPGDWVCQRCAKGTGIDDAGREGYEFPSEEIVSPDEKVGRKRSADEILEDTQESGGTDDGDKSPNAGGDGTDEDSEDESPLRQRAKKPKRRTVIEESSDDE